MTTQSFTALGRKYTHQKSFPTNISADYLNDSGSHWGVWEMVRESVQNMVDEAQYMADTNGGDILDHCIVDLQNYSGNLDLRDKGRGVDWAKIFLIGVSGKRGTHYKGQKGEGESLSFLVAARLGIGKTMFSQDWAVKARLEDYQGGPYQVLAFDLYKTNKPIEGTVWRFDNHPEITAIYKNLGEYFPELSKQAQREAVAHQRRMDKMNADSRKRQIARAKREIKKRSTSSKAMIITPKQGQPARLYVRGVYVKDIQALFSYNIDVEINRDRSMVDEWEILKQIAVAFDSKDLLPSQAEIYWKNAVDGPKTVDALEYRLTMNLLNNEELMRKAFYKAFGKMGCLSTNPNATLDAASDGFKPVKLYTHVTNTAKNLAVKLDTQSAGYEGDILPWKAATNQAKALISKLQEIGKAFGFDPYPVVPVLKVLGRDSSKTMGLYNSGKVYLMKSTLEGSRAKLLETFIHECGHGETGFDDFTREFTDWFEEFNVKSLTGTYDHVRPLIEELYKI